MDTGKFVLSFTEGNVDDEHMDLSNLEPPIKINNKVPGKFKHELGLGSRIIEEFIALSPKTYSFKGYPNKEKGVKNCNNAKQEQYYNALMYNTERSVDECRIQKVGDNMTTTKTSEISLNTFDVKRVYINDIKSYPHDENLYPFKRDLVKNFKKRETTIRHTSLDLDKNQLTNNILELTINDDRKIIEAALKL